MNKLTEWLTKPFLEEDILNEGARDPGIFKAIFLAGGPGSGKSFVAQKLFGIPEKINVSKTGLKMVNQDSELELLLKKYFGTTDIDNMPDELFADLTGVDKQGKPVDYDTSGLRKFAKSLSKERLRLYTNGKLGVIIDGTGHNFSKIKSRRKDLMDMGYDTYMVFVNTNLDVALERNEKRDRVVPASIVKKSWQDVQNNMGAFQGLFGGSNFMIVQNNKMLSDSQITKHFKMLVSKGIDKFLKKPIKSKIGKAWLRREKKHQKVFKDPGQSKFFESIKVPVEIGDTIKMGRFKNKKVVVKSIDWNEKGDLLINGRSAMKFRIEKKVDESKAELYKLYSKAMKMIPGSANQKKIKKQIADLRKKLGMNEAQKTVTSKSFDKKRESGTWTVIGHMKKKGKSIFHVRDEKTKKRFDVKLMEQKEIKKVIGVFGGRFQPFHSGHLATYKWLAKQVDEAYITTSNIKQLPRHPMDFKEKVRHMVKMGIPKNRIVQERTPYVADNVLKKFNPKTTAVVYAFGQKDAGRLKGGTKKSGGKTYYQDYKKSKGDIKGFEEHGYFVTAPQFGKVSGTMMRKLLGDPDVKDDQRLKGFKKVFGYYDKGIYTMMTNKFRKLFESIENFLVDVDFTQIVNESTTAGSPTDDGPPTFYRGFSDYKKYSKRWLDDMYRDTGWEVIQYILSDGATNPDFDYTLNYNVVPAVAYGHKQSGEYGTRFGTNNPIKSYKNHIEGTVLHNIGYELVKWMGITPDGNDYTGVAVETPVLPGVGNDNVGNTEKKKLKESYKAVSIKTGYDSTFQTKQAMQKAIKSGSHTAIGSPKANKVQKKPKFGIDPEKMKAIAAKAAAKAKKKAKVKPKKDLSSTGGYTPPGETWKKDREPNIDENGIDQIRDRNEQQDFNDKFLYPGDDMNSDVMQKYHGRMTERYEKHKNTLSPEQQEKRKKAIHSWKVQGGYEAIQAAIEDGKTTQKEIEERNDIISEASHTTVTKVDGAIERGIHVSPNDIDDLLDDFVVGEMVEIPDEDGHGASGFSISTQTARSFSEQEQDSLTRCYDRDGCKTSVLFRIKPNSNGELRGLYIDGEKDQSGGYWYEGEITRSDKSKAKVVSVEKIRSVKNGKMTVIITLQEPDDLTESYTRTFSKRSAELSKKYLEGPVNPKPKNNNVKEHKNVNIMDRITLDEEVNLLIEGGAYGHLNHPFDDKNLTFSDFRTLIINTLQGKLDSEGAVTEKTDGQNIMISWKNNKLIAARNKGHIKNHGANALSIGGIKSMFAGRGDIEYAFVSAMRDLQKALKSLSKKQKDKIFGEGKKFMSLEVIYPKTANVIPYDKSLLQFHGTIEYDSAGSPIGEDRGSARMLAGMIKQINQNIQKTYSITKPFVTNLPKVKDFSKRQSYFLGKLKKLQNQYNLGDTYTLSDYHQAYWMEYIYNGAKQTDYKNPSNDILVKLTKRWAFFDKSYKIPQIRKDLQKYPKFLDWVLTTDKIDHAKLQKQHIRDWEVLFFELGAEILSNLSDFIAANPSKATQQIRKDLKNAINKVKKSKDPKVLNTLKTQLDRLNAIGGLKSVVPSEGITFVFKGKLYKYTGAFAPANQILGMLKFV